MPHTEFEGEDKYQNGVRKEDFLKLIAFLEQVPSNRCAVVDQWWLHQHTTFLFYNRTSKRTPHDTRK